MLTKTQLQTKRARKASRRAGLRATKRRFQKKHGDMMGEKLYRLGRERDEQKRGQRQGKKIPDGPVTRMLKAAFARAKGEDVPTGETQAETAPAPGSDR